MYLVCILMQNLRKCNVFLICSETYKAVLYYFRYAHMLCCVIHDKTKMLRVIQFS